MEKNAPKTATKSTGNSSVDRRLARNARRRQTIKASSRARKADVETCNCGKHHTPGANYYVSMVDGARTALLAGPFKSHPQALALVAAVRELAYQIDPKSHWYAFGTLAMSRDYNKPGLLNNRL